MPRPFKYDPPPSQQERFAYVSFPALSRTIVCRRRSRLKAVWRLCVSSSATVVVLASVAAAQAEPAATNSNSVVVTPDRIAGFVAEASQRFAIPSSLIRAVMRAESLGDARALSPKGAMGLMQIMPETWAELRLRYGLGTDPYDPRDNITAGTAYLRELHDRYGERGFLAAYNAGPGRYEAHLATGRPLPSETLAYITAIASLIGAHSGDEGSIAIGSRSWTSASLFVRHTATGSAPSSVQTERAPVDGMAPSRAALTPLSDGLFANTSGRSKRP